MRLRRSLAAAALVVAVTSCEQATEPLAESAAPGAPAASHAGEGVLASTSGGGHFLIGGVIDVRFALTANQTGGDLSAAGQARHSLVFQGELIEFHQRVICMAVDPVNDRAWIGGVITQNQSTHPAFTGQIHQPGHDIWFRVVDYGEGDNASQPDRSTFVGFEGGAGIDTSLEYCELQIWPEGDARTSPVTEGNIQVRD